MKLNQATRDALTIFSRMEKTKPLIGIYSGSQRKKKYYHFDIKTAMMDTNEYRICMVSDTPMRCSLKNIRDDTFRIRFYLLSFLAQQGFTCPHLYITVPCIVVKIPI